MTYFVSAKLRIANHCKFASKYKKCKNSQMQNDTHLHRFDGLHDGLLRLEEDISSRIVRIEQIDLANEVVMEDLLRDVAIVLRDNRAVRADLFERNHVVLEMVADVVAVAVAVRAWNELLAITRIVVVDAAEHANRTVSFVDLRKHVRGEAMHPVLLGVREHVDHVLNIKHQLEHLCACLLILTLSQCYFMLLR